MRSILLKKPLGLGNSTVLGAREEGGTVVVRVRPHARERCRCPVCGRRCRVHDAMPPRTWRAQDLGSSECRVEYAPRRVECPEHGVHTESVPWARRGSRFTREFEDQVAWLACNCTTKAVSELMRLDWHTVGPVCARVLADAEASSGASRFDGLSRIGIDETSYKKGHRYMTVVVDHDRGRVVWCCEGHGKDRLNAFFDLLTEGQRASIEVVTADGASWIADVVSARCPNAGRAMDPFHVVGWATDALDGVRRDAWNEARRALKAAPEGDKAARRAAADAAGKVKGSRLSLLKNPEDLTERQSERLSWIARSDGRLYRAYLLKEALRDVFKAGSGEECASLLGSWLSWACRCRVPQMVEVSRKVRKRFDAIVLAVARGVSNARVEATNAKIKLAVRMARGFRNVGNLIALVMLRCSDLKPTLPGRNA